MSKVKWSLSQHITEHLANSRLGDPREPTLWPSEASAVLTDEYGEEYIVGQCRRSTFFRYATAKYYFYPDIDIYDSLVEELVSNEIKPDNYMRWIWEAGKLYEDFVVEMAKRSGVYVESQVQIVIPKLGIVGKLDLIVRDPTTGKFIAQEIKSIYGHNANEILGTPGMRNKSLMGTPRDSNMMQLALYDWHLKPRIPNLGSSRLYYGARDTGRDAEYEVSTYLDDDLKTIRIKYQGIAPHVTSPIVSDITINNILSNYQYVLNHINENKIPKRDYELEYSQDKIQTLYERNELSKTNREQHQKVLDRIAENQTRESEGKALKKEIKSVEMGDWQCDRCQFKNFCYNKDGSPRNG